MHTDHPPIIVISGAIGSGKGTIVHALEKELHLHWVPTHTTRPMRHDDSTLSRRIFDTEATFQRHVDREEFIETIERGGHRYGLLRDDLEHELRQGHPVILEMNTHGGVKIAEAYPHSLLIFVTADETNRRERITHRNMDEREVAERMQEAREEEAMAHKAYDYIVENVEHYPGAAISDITEIILEQFPELKQ